MPTPKPATLSAIATPSPPRARAAADQIDIQAWEGGLLELARTHHPTVAWWHGYRATGDRFGSYCYVCEAPTVTWNSNSGPPQAARVLIHQHKLDHRSGVIPTPGITIMRGTAK